MKTKPLVALMLTSLLVGILAVAIPIKPAAAANENVTLTITLPTMPKGPGDINSFFDVYVDISLVTDLFGFDIKVAWNDSTLIALDNDTSNSNTATELNGVWGAGNWLPVIESTGGGGGSGAYYRVVALSTRANGPGFTGSHHLMNLHFKILRSCNFLLQATITIQSYKLSDSVWQPIPVQSTVPGLFEITATKPDLELVLYDPHPIPSKPYEYCKIFEVKVYATDICANLKDYDFTFHFDNTLLKFVDVDKWGVLGDNVTGEAGYELISPGTIHVWDLGGSSATGDPVYLFALTFHIEFNDDIEHIWRTTAPHDLDAIISFLDAQLSFLEGTIPMSGITMPGPLTVTVQLIRGDVGPVDGMVDVFDLATVARFYDQTYPDYPEKYDLTMDHTIDIFDLVVIATNFLYGY